MLRSTLDTAPLSTASSKSFDITVALNTTLSALMVVVAIALGFLLRHLLVRRLKKTVLDNWIIQALGIIAVIIPSILGIIGALATWNVQWVLLLFTAFYPYTQPLMGLGSIVLQTLLIVVLGYAIARTLSAMTTRALSNTRMDINMRTFMARMIFFITLAITASFILAQWNIPIGVPIAVLGTFTVTLTVALQDVLKNLIAGFYILVERPFFIGDQISVTSAGMTNYVGKVEDIQLRATIMRLPSGEEVSIPNIFIFANPIINNTHYSERRAVLEIGLPCAEFNRSEITSQVQALLKVRIEVESNPEPMIMISRYVDDKIYFQIRFWVKSGQLIDVSDIILEIHKILPNANILVIEPT
jgi:Small-conductance mechanosensitive channel